jgi:Spy/CpxP family protein refolding chaperone
MKRILLPAALLLAGAAAFAQQQTVPPPPDANTAPATAQHARHPHDPHKTAMKLSKELNLTPDQASKLEPVLTAQSQKLSDLQSNTALSAQEQHKQMHAIHKDTQAQLAGILTPDQLQQMKAMEKAHHGHKGGDAQPLNAPPAPPSA